MLNVLPSHLQEVDVNLSDKVCLVHCSLIINFLIPQSIKDKADLTSCSVGNSADTVAPANTYRVPPAVSSMVD